MASIVKLLQKVSDLNKMFELDFDDFQGFDDMRRTFDLGVTKMIGTSSCTLTLKEDDHLRFDVEIPPGLNNAYESHWHDCLEVCTVKEGVMGDLTLTDKTATVGDTINYGRMIPHRPCNIGKNTLKITVDFYRVT